MDSADVGGNKPHRARQAGAKVNKKKENERKKQGVTAAQRKNHKVRSDLGMGPSKMAG